MRIFVLGLVISLPLLATPWAVDPAHSAALFKVRHMMVSNVPGKITGIKGVFELDAKDFTKSSVAATLDANTISTDNAKRDAHLRSEDFFDTAKNPQITFKSKKIEKDGSNYKVTGDLTLRGVTKEVVLSGVTLTDPIKDLSGNLRRGFSGNTSIQRKEFGVSWNKSLDNGGFVVGDKVDIEINVELTEDQKPAPVSG